MKVKIQLTYAYEYVNEQLSEVLNVIKGALHEPALQEDVMELCEYLQKKNVIDDCSGMLQLIAELCQRENTVCEMTGKRSIIVTDNSTERLRLHRRAPYIELP